MTRLVIFGWNLFLFGLICYSEVKWAFSVKSIVNTTHFWLHYFKKYTILICCSCSVLYLLCLFTFDFEIVVLMNTCKFKQSSSHALEDHLNFLLDIVLPDPFKVVIYLMLKFRIDVSTMRSPLNRYWL